MEIFWRALVAELCLFGNRLGPDRAVGPGRPYCRSARITLWAVASQGGSPTCPASHSPAGRKSTRKGPARGPAGPLAPAGSKTRTPTEVPRCLLLQPCRSNTYEKGPLPAVLQNVKPAVDRQPGHHREDSQGRWSHFVLQTFTKTKRIRFQTNQAAFISKNCKITHFRSIFAT